MVFNDRAEASRILTERLNEKNLEFDTIAGIPKGGLFIGSKLAPYFDAELEVIGVDSLTLPNYEKFELGAVADDGTLWVEDKAVRGLDIPGEVIESSRLKALKNAQKIYDTYNTGDRDLRGKSVLLVDEGANRSNYLMAAIGLLKKNNAGKITVALPVASRDVVMDINAIADKSLIVEQPRFLSSVEAYFDSLNNLSKNKVQRMVKES